MAWVLGWTLAVVASGTPASAQGAEAPQLRGWTTCAWGSDDCNVCVPDAVAAIGGLRDHGDILGFQMNGAPDVDVSHHWQGIQRLMGRDGRYLAVSRSIASEDTDVAFVIVEMGSRDLDGQRFRSNRLHVGTDFARTPPPTSDGVAVVVPHEPGFDHAGGMQALGNLLAVPFEGGAQSKVVFYDVADPLHPVRLANEALHVVDGGISSEAGTATFGKLADGRFLLVIGRSNANILDFYVSNGTDPATTKYRRFDTWDEDELETEICGAFGCDCSLPGADCEFGNYQNLNLVQQCEGTLFMVGTHANSGGGLGNDFADVYRVENGDGNDVQITKVGKRHLFCSYRGETQCEGDAAGGIYIDPAGQLLVYLTEHDNDGPIESSPGCSSGRSCSVKFEEFRPVPHGACSRVHDAWVELYDDTGFADRSLMIDFVDRKLEDYTNYDRVDGFEDKGSAVRWCLPEGVTYRLWEDKNSCGGSSRDLVGTGRLEQVSNLGGFGDETSCSEWRGGPFADAGDERSVECAGAQGTAIDLDGRGSSDAAGDAVSCAWGSTSCTIHDPSACLTTATCPSGTNVVSLSVRDGERRFGADAVTLTVRDGSPPSGRITFPPSGSCHAGPVMVTDDFRDTCDPGLDRTYAPPPGPTYADHGDHGVRVIAADGAGNVASDSVSFTIDRVPPGVQVVLAEPQFVLPMTLDFGGLFVADDADGAEGGVVAERILWDGCVLFDGRTFGDGDGLLTDESLQLDLPALCAAIVRCGLEGTKPLQIRVEAEDCAGNVGFGERTIPSVSVVPDACRAVPPGGGV